ncbi:FkbM family methyltransferase [Plantactinospora siamensis]|uniref:FkbM family methyltransferase n=1 Tax=Plantactinospora siamensis TaxID=555372 RepID=A0ABV6NZ71_9ACTN
MLGELLADPSMSRLRRSLTLSYADPAVGAGLDALYADFVRPGDLVFDLGAHVGDRTGSFRRLGARVVAVEPQPLCVRALRALYGPDDRVTVVEAACGARPGRTRLHVNSVNPTVSTASPHFVRAAHGADGWRHEVWDEELEVPLVTVDGLIDRFGVPAFVKIDVEGLEDQVLAGLTRPLAALSFEITTIQRELAVTCLSRLTGLGFARFNLALGDAMSLAPDDWRSAAELAACLRALPDEANSGDVYCRPA